MKMPKIVTLKKGEPLSKTMTNFPTTTTTTTRQNIGLISSMESDSLNDTLDSPGNHSHIRGPDGGVFNGGHPLQSDLALFLIQAIIIISISRAIHMVLGRLRQPRVIAEVIGGICLGPSVFGNIPAFSETIFPKRSLGFLALISDIGLVLYLFLVGLELDPKAFFGDLKRSMAISCAGIALPFALGIAVSWGLYNVLLEGPPEHLPPFTVFLLFTGVAMSITAFPVLARILSELKLLSTPVGLMSVTAAAINDAAAWLKHFSFCWLSGSNIDLEDTVRSFLKVPTTLLALIVSILNAADNVTIIYVFVTIVIYALILLGPGRMAFQAFHDRFLAKRSDAITQLLMAAIFVFVFLSAWLTEIIGLHAIFGSFLLGLCIPRNSDLPIQLTEKVEDLVNIVFLPLFFASSGLKTKLGLLDDGLTWLFLFLVLIVACSGKIFGCTLTARFAGIPWRDSWTIGFLMNTKGLVELIVLNIGLDAEVINPRIFAIMIVMALVTTFMTSPIVSFLYPPHYYNQQILSRKSTAAVHPETGSDIISYANLRCLLYVEALDSIPAVAGFMKLLRAAFADAKRLSLNVLKILETCERSSTVMIASQSAAARQNDSTLKMVDFFGDFLGIETNCFLLTSPASDFSEQLNTVCANEQCSLLVVPWNEKSKDQTSEIAKRSEITTLIVYDRLVTSSSDDQGAWSNQNPPSTSNHNAPANMRSLAKLRPSILVPFIGGSSDREALKLAMKLCKNASVAVTVLCIKALPVKDLTMVKRYENGFDLSYYIQHDSADIALLDRVRDISKACQASALFIRETDSDHIVATIVEECAAAKYDFVLCGHNSATIICETPIPALASRAGQDEAAANFAARVNELDEEFGETSITPKISRAEHRRFSMMSAAGADNSGNTFRRSFFKKQRPFAAGNRASVLGKLGSGLCEASISSRLLVVRNPVSTVPQRSS